MLRVVILAIAFVILITLAVMLIMAVLTVLAVACLVGIPLWFLSKQWLHSQGLSRVAQNPIDRLKELYVQDKIDLFEFERRVRQHIAVEQ